MSVSYSQCNSCYKLINKDEVNKTQYCPHCKSSIYGKIYKQSSPSFILKGNGWPSKDMKKKT